MNKQKLKQNLHCRIRLKPLPKRTWKGQVQEQKDDIWIVQRVQDNGVVELSNIRTGHVAKLGSDHIHHYDSDPMSENDGLKHGFFILSVQLHFIDGELEIEPILRS